MKSRLWNPDWSHLCLGPGGILMQWLQISCARRGSNFDCILEAICSSFRFMGISPASLCDADSNDLPGWLCYPWPNLKVPQNVRTAWYRINTVSEGWLVRLSTWPDGLAEWNNLPWWSWYDNVLIDSTLEWAMDTEANYGDDSDWWVRLAAGEQAAVGGDCGSSGSGGNASLGEMVEDCYE